MAKSKEDGRDWITLCGNEILKMYLWSNFVEFRVGKNLIEDR